MRLTVLTVFLCTISYINYLFKIYIVSDDASHKATSLEPETFHWSFPLGSVVVVFVLLKVLISVT